MEKSGSAGSNLNGNQHRSQLSRQFVTLITITIKPFLPNCPGRDLVKSVWRFLRGTCLSSRAVFSYDILVDECCGSPQRLVNLPKLIVSIGLRDWAHPF